MKKIVELAIGLCLLATATATLATKPTVEFTVMHSTGGVSDVTSRFIASHLPEPYVVVNRPGAGGRTAIRHLLSEHSMMLATMAQVYVTNPINYNDLEYDPYKDLEVLSVIGAMPSVLVCNKRTGFVTFDNFIKSKNPVSFAFGGFGSSEHIATELLVRETKVNATMVPYAQGGNKSVVDLVGGHIDCMFANYPTIKPHIVNENLQILLTSHSLGYNVPTWQDVYKTAFPFQSYLSIIVPSAMDNAVKNKIKSQLESSFKHKNYKQELLRIGVFPVLHTEKSKINSTVEYTKTLRNFIVTNNIKTN
jgi:tripartite-type tricarboxylate transporter receptor subunit TctC